MYFDCPMQMLISSVVYDAGQRRLRRSLESKKRETSVRQVLLAYRHRSNTPAGKSSILQPNESFACLLPPLVGCAMTSLLKQQLKRHGLTSHILIQSATVNWLSYTSVCCTRCSTTVHLVIHCHTTYTKGWFSDSIVGSLGLPRKAVCR